MDKRLLCKEMKQSQRESLLILMIVLLAQVCASSTTAPYNFLLSAIVLAD